MIRVRRCCCARTPRKALRSGSRCNCRRSLRTCISLPWTDRRCDKRPDTSPHANLQGRLPKRELTDRSESLRSSRDGSHAMRQRDEKGTRSGVAIRRRVRDCPRNCRRRATLKHHWLITAGKDSQAKTRKSGDLPSNSVKPRTGRSGRRHDGTPLVRIDNLLPLRARTCAGGDMASDLEHIFLTCIAREGPAQAYPPALAREIAP